MRFGALRTRYDTDDDYFMTFFIQNQSGIASINSFNVCKQSLANWVTSETEAEARATRVVTVPTVNYSLIGLPRMNSALYDAED